MEIPIIKTTLCCVHSAEFVFVLIFIEKQGVAMKFKDCFACLPGLSIRSSPGVPEITGGECSDG